MKRQSSLMYLILSYTHNEEDREKALALFNQMLIEKVDDAEIEKSLVGILNNGLMWGNWPWTSYSVEKD